MQILSRGWIAGCGVSLLALLLAGCGGGDGGGPAVTPPPVTKPTGANSSLIGPLVSENFVNDAALGTITVSPGVDRGNAGSTTATIVYDASSQSYTLTVGAASKTFSPANINASLTNSAETVYEITSGNTTDSLTLTKPGTSGRFNYQYVGAAFWQSTTVGTNSGSGALYAVTYGEPTASGSVPTTGTGTYTIDALGVESPGQATGFTGQGTVAINFATDKFALNGTLIDNGNTKDPFSGAGTLTASGQFSGSFDTALLGSGSINGRLYGPNAQEIGGTFYTNDSTSSSALVGAIIGRSSAGPASSDSFATLTSPEFATVASARQFQAGTGTSALGTVQVAIDQSGLDAVFAKDYTSDAYFQATRANGNSMGNLLTAAGTGGIAGTELINPPGNATGTGSYATSYVYAAVSGNVINGNAALDYFTFGIATPGSELPATGSASYAIALDGTLANPKTAKAASEISGTGTIALDFATGQVTTSGTLSNGLSTGPGQAANFSGSGTLTASSASFATNLTVNGLAAGQGTGAIATSYTGNVQGALYGPTGTETGGVFSASASDGSNLSGAFTGTGTGLPGAPGNAQTTLLTLASPVTNPQLASVYGGYQSQVVGPNSSSPISYDPTTKTYVVPGYDGNSFFSGQLSGATLGPVGVNTGNSNATFTAYDSTANPTRVFNPGPNNPTLQLSYVSFVQLNEYAYSPISNTQMPFSLFQLYGLPTAPGNMPTTGSATYSGVVYGSGYNPAIATTDLTVTGTGQLNANFATGAITTTLVLNAAPMTGGASQSLGTYTFTGATGAGSFTAYMPTVNSNPTGNMLGQFYGPTASEVGAVFNITTIYITPQPMNATNIAGVFVGKRN